MTQYLVALHDCESEETNIHRVLANTVEGALYSAIHNYLEDQVKKDFTDLESMLDDLEKVFGKTFNNMVEEIRGWGLYTSYPEEL